MKKVLAVSGASFALIAVVAFAVNGRLMIEGWRQKRAVDTTFRRVSEALVRRDFPGFYSLTDAEFQREISISAFVKLQQELEAQNGELKSIIQGPTSVEGSG